MALADIRKQVDKIKTTYDRGIVEATANNLIRKIAFDSPQLTYMFSGFSYDRIHQFFSPESSGKSSLSTYMASQLQKKMPIEIERLAQEAEDNGDKDKAKKIRKEFADKQVVIYLDYERTFDPVYAENLGLNVDEEHFILLQPDTLEDGFNMIEPMVKSGSICCIIFDSDAAAPTALDNESEVGATGFNGAKGANTLKEVYKRYGILCSNYLTPLITISQERQSMNVMAKLPTQCVVPSTIVDIVDENGTQEQITMEQLFEKVGFSDYKKMTTFEFYDVSYKKIYIKSYNENDKKVEYKTVESVVYKGEENIYDVVLKDGTVLLSGSAGHYIYDADKEDYVSLGDTKEVCVLNCVGDKIYCFVKDTSKKEPVLDIQVRDNSNYFSNDILSHNTGGTAIKFFSSTRNRLSKLDTLKNGDDAIGIQIRVRNYKNKTGVPNRDAIMNLYFDGGFNSDDEYFDFLVMFGLIHKAGGWFDAADIGMPKLQGSAKVKDWLKQNPDVYDGLKKKVDSMLMSKNELDENNVDYEKAEKNGVTIEETKTPAQLAMEALDLQDSTPDLGL